MPDGFEFRVLGQLKFFDSSLPEDDPENYYMEREWRVPAGVLHLFKDWFRDGQSHKFCSGINCHGGAWYHAPKAKSTRASSRGSVSHNEPQPRTDSPPLLGSCR
jgi:hypothetical protein